MNLFWDMTLITLQLKAKLMFYTSYNCEDVVGFTAFREEKTGDGCAMAYRGYQASE
jgi:hypothetical protein